MHLAAMHSRRRHGGESLPSFKRSMAIVLGMVTAAILLQASSPNAFEPERLIIEPDVAFIRGVGGTHTLLFTAIDSEGSRRDVTPGIQVTVDVPDVVREISPGTFEARKFGFAKLRAVYQDLRAEAAVIVQPRRTSRVDFATEVAPIFSQRGCNNTNCHGALNGQSGFKLSLFGYDPDADFEAIVHHSDGRRIDRDRPDKSLLLMKPTFEISHGGGHLIQRESFDYQTLVDWIRDGAPKHTGNVARLQRIDVYPTEFTVLEGPGSTQQIVVVGHYSDGSQQDLTQRVRYSTEKNEVLEVSLEGKVTARSAGEGTVLVRTLGHVQALRIGVAAAGPSDSQPLEPANFIDELVFDKLGQLNVPHSQLSTDAEFIRRVYLDTIGIVPTAAETRRFLADPSDDRRARLVDELLRRPEYAEFWAVKWGDLFANSVLTSSDGTAYLQDWLRRAFEENTPYDEFVTRILTSTGSTWEVGAVNFFSRSIEDVTTLASQAFLGLGIECARCHDHPSVRWTREDFLSMAAFFSQLAVKGRRPPPVESIRYIEYDKEFRHPETKQVVRPRFLDGSEPLIRPLEDRRAVLARWMTSNDNPWFAHATVNRFWNQFMGRPLVDPVDDFRASNPATNEALLDRLAQDFVEHGYDLHHLIRMIANSKTYQLSSAPEPGNRDDEVNYSRYYLKRLTAEQLIDSIVQITGVPQDYLGYYPGVRAVDLADPGVPSAFLDMFDRPKRDAAKCERNESVSLRQAMHLLVGDTVNEKIRTSAEKGELASLLRDGKSDNEIVEHLYLAALSRLPEPNERDDCQTVISRAKDRSTGLQNVLWALVSTNEFLYNH
ncbi:MAG: DUF1553 domain-containing protein [Acidobacteriia bacterium]|nr:DUF1553 domain-containing protein [Terriglobia bacterium]